MEVSIMYVKSYTDSYVRRPSESNTYLYLDILYCIVKHIKELDHIPT